MTRTEHKHTGNENTRFFNEKNYWAQKLSGELFKAGFPYDNETFRTNEIIFDVLEFEFSAETEEKILKLSNRSDPKIFMILVTGIVAVVSKFTNLDDIIVGAPIYRQPIAGDFINTVLILRNRVREDITLKELLLDVRDTITEAVKFQNYPLDYILNDLNIPPDVGLFDIVVLLENIHDIEYIKDVSADSIFHFKRDDDCIKIGIRYNSQLYKESTIRKIAGCLDNFLSRAISNYDEKIIDIDMLSTEEKEQMLYNFNAAGESASTGGRIEYLFEKQVETNPHNIAVVFRDRQVTYKALNEKSNRVARILQEEKIGIDSVVGLLMESSIEMIACILGILKAGGCYLPLNPNDPAARLKYIIDDSDMDRLLFWDEIPRIYGEMKNVYSEKLLALDDSRLNLFKTSNINIKSDGHAIADIIYTSGTTGNPKGVLVEHKGITNYTLWRIATYHYSGKDVTLQLLSYCFDGYGSNFFSSIFSGGKLAITGESERIDAHYIVNLIERENVTNMSLVPVSYRMILNAGVQRNLQTLRFVVLAGERCPAALLQESKKMLPGTRLINEYGLTETSITTTSNINMNENNCNIIGRPISNSSVFILDRNQKLTPVGIKGELCIGGAPITRGYVNNVLSSHEKYIPNPYRTFYPQNDRFKSDDVLLKTGDIARWLPDGSIELLGRMDEQIKIRGNRIEIGEIEKHILLFEKIKKVKVLLHENADGDNYLAAYLIAGNGLDISMLETFLAAKLPGTFIPSRFVLLKSFPLTRTGKVDSRALLKIGVEEMGKNETGGKSTTPGNAIEQKLAEIWADILKKNKNMLYREADFFESGGHSLAATLVVSRIHKEFGVRIPIVDFFRESSLERMAKYIKSRSKEIYTPINNIEEKEYYALSPAQQRLFYIQQINPESISYNTPLMLLLEGAPDYSKLEKAFRSLIDRHESLRTSFLIINGQPYQRIHRRVEFEVQFVDPDIYRQRETARMSDNSNNSYTNIDEITNNFVRPFAMEKAPLMRIGLIKLEKGKHLLMMDMHHIIGDERSFEIFCHEYISLYNEKKLPDLRYQYRDFMIWEKGRKEVGIQENYWIEKFNNLQCELDLPLDNKRPKNYSFFGDTSSFSIGEKEAGLLNEMAFKYEVTFYHLLLTVVIIFLSKICDQEDIILGTPVGARRHADLENIIGMFVNTLVLYFPINKDAKFSELLSSVREQCLLDFENQDYPFDDLVNKLGAQRAINRNPLFDFMFSYHGEEETIEETKDFFIRAYPFKNRTAKFDLMLVANIKKEGIHFSFEYKKELFERRKIDRLNKCLETIISDILSSPDKKIKEIEIMPEVEKREILVGLHENLSGYLQDATIHELFEKQVKEEPDHAALVFQDKSLSYRELNRSSLQMAQLLRERGVKPNTIVGIMVDRSIDMIVGILSVLQSGGVYLPIDPEYPQQRFEYMLKDGNVDILLTTAEALDRKEMDMKEINIINKVEKLIIKEMKNLNLTAIGLENVNKSSDLAYVIYTSGTTGKPKGAMIEHRNLVSLMFSDNNIFDFSNKDIWVMFHSYCFDFSVWEMYGALLFGGKLILISRFTAINTVEFLNVLKLENVTVLNQTPTAFKNLMRLELEDNRQFLSTKYIIFGGETLQTYLLAPWKEKYPGTKLINMYGITETTIFVTHKEITDKDIESNRNNIGRSISTLRTYILDNDLNILPPGIRGELFVAGAGVGRGYLDLPELTNRKFVKSPYKKGEIIYKSGDFARLSDTGDLEYIGRLDFQVKIRGFRIEKDEIEYNLKKYEKIQDAVVLIKETEPGEKNLYVYYVAKKDCGEILNSELREFLSLKIPAYMIPSYFIKIDKIPVTSNGKINESELLKYEISQNIINENEQANDPEKNIEKEVSRIWKEILNLKQVSMNDNFFEIGGDSLKILQVNRLLQENFEMNISITSLYEYPDIHSLSQYIGERIGERVELAPGNIRGVEVDRSDVLSRARRSRRELPKEIDK